MPETVKHFCTVKRNSSFFFPPGAKRPAWDKEKRPCLKQGRR